SSTSLLESRLVLDVDNALDGCLRNLIREENFKAQSGQSLCFSTLGRLGPARVCLLGLGSGDKVTHERFRRLGGRAAEAARTCRARVLAFGCQVPELSGLNVKKMAAALVEGLRLGTYRFEKYKKEPEDLPPWAGPETVRVAAWNARGKTCIGGKELDEVLARAGTLASGVNTARDLINEIPEVMYPEELAQRAGKLASGIPGLEVKVLDEKGMARQKMNAALGVARGSVRPPCFIELSYAPGGTGNSAGLFLVGKGVTFDSGGLNIKTGDHMATMKADMSGAAAVIAAMTVIARLKLKIRVTALVAAVENMPGGRAYKPDDVLTAMNGTTIEVGNTDAEGRLTLADSLSWAIENKAGRIVDLATLTGACMMGLGPHTAGAMGNDPAWLGQVCEAAEDAGEKVAPLPLDEDMEDDIKSEIADVKNIGASRYGGAITGGLFLKKFVGETPWVHLDIAGPAHTSKKRDYAPVGGTGFGVRLLVCLVEKLVAGG
ncbi:MAG: leucyl aminopeptidase, partial [Gemmatimonadota bacterium]|nr:leucyl aminopeptidase [Gemmatimonadota bacterium]